MGMSDYVRGLRAKIGNDFLLVPSAHVAIRDAGGRVLLVQHVEGRWQIPGGAVDPGEHPRDAAARECLEEAQIVVRIGEILGAFGGPTYRARYQNGDEIGFVPILYSGEIVDGAPRPDEEEIQEVGWFSLDETDALEMNPATREMLRAL